MYNIFILALSFKNFFFVCYCSDLRGSFEALRKGSFKLQNHYILTSQLKRKKDERGWEVCEVASNAKRVAIETEESNKLYEDKAK